MNNVVMYWREKVEIHWSNVHLANNAPPLSTCAAMYEASAICASLFRNSCLPMLRFTSTRGLRSCQEESRVAPVAEAIGAEGNPPLVLAWPHHLCEPPPVRSQFKCTPIQTKSDPLPTPPRPPPNHSHSTHTSPHPSLTNAPPIHNRTPLKHRPRPISQTRPDPPRPAQTRSYDLRRPKT